MKVHLDLHLPAFSINAVYTKNRCWKTSEYKEWSSNVFHQLNSDHNLEKLEQIRNAFNSKTDGFIVTLIHFYPKETLFTNKGSISSRSHDLSNIEKPLIDLLFLPTYFNQPHPYGCKNLNVDDKFILELHSYKKPALKHKIEITIEIIKTECLPLPEPVRPSQHE